MLSASAKRRSSAASRTSTDCFERSAVSTMLWLMRSTVSSDPGAARSMRGTSLPVSSCNSTKQRSAGRFSNTSSTRRSSVASSRSCCISASVAPCRIFRTRRASCRRAGARASSSGLACGVRPRGTLGRTWCVATSLDSGRSSRTWSISELKSRMSIHAAACALSGSISDGASAALSSHPSSNPPILMRSPSRSSCSVTRTPSTNVPFALPRSRNIQRSPSTEIRACWRDTSWLGRRMSQPSLRPIVTPVGRTLVQTDFSPALWCSISSGNGFTSDTPGRERRSRAPGCAKLRAARRCARGGEA
jgi:hypothetical protein